MKTFRLVLLVLSALSSQLSTALQAQRLIDNLQMGGASNQVNSGATLTVKSGATFTYEAGASVGGSMSEFRTDIGLGIGSGVQAYDADLTTYAGITPSANVQSLLAAADYSAMRTQLGLVIGTNVQAFDADLGALAGLTSAADKLPYFTGSGTAAVTDFTSFGRSLVDDADASAARTTLGVVPGTDVLGVPGSSAEGDILYRNGGHSSSQQKATASAY